VQRCCRRPHYGVCLDIISETGSAKSISAKRTAVPSWASTDAADTFRFLFDVR
jgi:hypothetical protein